MEKPAAIPEFFQFPLGNGPRRSIASGVHASPCLPSGAVAVASLGNTVDRVAVETAHRTDRAVAGPHLTAGIYTKRIGKGLREAFLGCPESPVYLSAEVQRAGKSPQRQQSRR